MEQMQRTQFISGSYLIQAIEFFRGVNGSFTFGTRWIHVGMLFKLVSAKTTDAAAAAAASDYEWPGQSLGQSTGKTGTTESKATIIK